MVKSTTTRKKILAAARDLFLFLAISVAQTLLTCIRCTRDEFFPVVGFTFVMWVMLWKGNTLLSRYLSAKISWLQWPVKRFLAGIFINISYTLLAVIALIALFEYSSGISLGKGSQYTIYGAVIITILISFFLHAREFLFFWRGAAFEKQKFEQESIQAKYESLKNQVSPHFLFNSLNALTNLVYEDPDKAVKFIKQLSEVYRYVIETREKEVVDISEELKFLEAYLFLQQIRFGDKLIVRVGKIDEGIKLPPLALQMLIENAIKHNIVSEEHPLTISLYTDKDFVVVENQLQKKRQLSETTSSGLGLENISRRYSYLSDKKVKIEEGKETFTVKLPVLNEPKP